MGTMDGATASGGSSCYLSFLMDEPSTAALMRHIYDQVLLSEDAKEGPRAFAGKRQPQWLGR